jgi:hypothetical protein
MKAIEAADPFMKRFARATLDVTRLETASAGRLVPSLPLDHQRDF